MTLRIASACLFLALASSAHAEITDDTPVRGITVTKTGIVVSPELVTMGDCRKGLVDNIQPLMELGDALAIFSRSRGHARGSAQLWARHHSFCQISTK